MRIGSHVGMSNVSITCTDEIIIGDWTDMGDGVKLFDTDFHSMVPSIRHSTKDFENAKKKGISIGKNVFVGANAMILKGSCLDDECCIGAGAIVTKNIGEKENMGLAIQQEKLLKCENVSEKKRWSHESFNC